MVGVDGFWFREVSCVVGGGWLEIREVSIGGDKKGKRGVYRVDGNFVVGLDL